MDRAMNAILDLFKRMPEVGLFYPTYGVQGPSDHTNT